jgi:hypothetical protein
MLVKKIIPIKIGVIFFLLSKYKYSVIIYLDNNKGEK